MLHTKKEAAQNLERDLFELQWEKMDNNNPMRINFLKTSIECWKICLNQ